MESAVPYKPVDQGDPVDPKTTVEDALGAEMESAHAKIERAHQASLEEEARKNAKPSPREIEERYREVDLRLKEVQLEELGLADLDSIDDPLRWARARNAQIARGIPYKPSATTVDEAGNRVEPEPAPTQSHDEQPAFTPVIPPDHPHHARMREAEDYFGADTIAKIATDFQQSGVDLLPGLCKELAQFENSPTVTIALMREPAVISHLNEVATRSPAMAANMLRDISQWLATGQVPSGEQAPAPKPSKPKPPETVAARASSAFDLENESMSPEEWARKRTAERRARGFSY